MTDIARIIALHEMWLHGRSGGKRADLTRANLSGANLRGANLTRATLTRADLSGATLSAATLTRADLRGADLRGADLHSADLSSANLRDATLSGADLRDANLRDADLTRTALSDAILTSADLSGVRGYCCPLTWVSSQELCPEGRGIIVYKTFQQHHPSPAGWVITQGSVITETCNPDRGTACGSGINVAPRDWGGFSSGDEVWRLLIKWRDLCTLVVPFGSDGKARVGRATILGRVE